MTEYIVKYLEVSDRGLNQMPSRLFLGGTKKNYKTFSQDRPRVPSEIQTGPPPPPNKNLED
jgi:hypothetical protein